MSTWFYTAEVTGYRMPVRGTQYEYNMRQLFANTIFFSVMYRRFTFCVYGFVLIVIILNVHWNYTKKCNHDKDNDGDDSVLE